MKQPQRKLIQFDILIADRKDPRLVTVVGIDLGTPEWAHGRRLAVHPTVHRTDPYDKWTVTDVQSGLAVASSDTKKSAIEFAVHSFGRAAHFPAEFATCFNNAELLRAKCDASCKAQPYAIELCKGMLRVKPDEQVEVL